MTVVVVRMARLALGVGREPMRVRCVYSPKIFFRPDLVVFRCAVRPLDGCSTWRASSYMWYVSRGDCVDAERANALGDAGLEEKV